MSASERDYIVFLEDIMEAIAKIERYTGGMTVEAFREHEMAIDAVIRNFEVLVRLSGTFPTT